MSQSDADLQESTECPTCGDGFDTNRGMLQHHTIVHGESLTDITKECDQCGHEFTKTRAKINNHENNFCSSECQHEFATDRVVIDCFMCGKEVERIPSNAYRRAFCSSDCQSKYNSEVLTGADALHWEGGKIQSECDRCGDVFKHHGHRVGRFCSNDCFHAHLSENAKESSPYYGSSWEAQREKALQRDGHQCAICGSEATLDVHHIQPFRAFGVENHKEANQLNNLITLCRKHHSRWEGIPLRPQTD